MRRTLALVVSGLLGCVGELVPLDDGGDEPPPNADPLLGCSLGCHGGDTSNAPPNDLAGQAATSLIGVGAHQAHLDPAPDWHRAITCADCHAVPQTVGAPGHMDDGDNTAELTFGMAAGPGASWNGTTCTTGCHGSAAIGATAPEPTWTRVDGAQAACGSCHGVPPPAPHPQEANCAACHPTMEEGSLAFRDPASHIDGKVDVGGAGATDGCTSCHGSSTSSAPPRDLSGDTLSTASGVGAHQAHLAPSTWHRAIACTNCHVVPLTVDAPGHRDGDNLAEVPFDALNPAGVYDRATSTCTNQYCHGNGRGNTGTISWVRQGADLACGDCHSINGTGMSGDHRRHIGEEGMRCSECHQTVVNANMGIIAAGLHVNGVHEVVMARGTWNAANRTCTNTACHGTETW